MNENEIRGGDRILVAPKYYVAGLPTPTREAVIVRCERTCDRHVRRGRRTFLVRYGDGTEERVSRGRLTLL